MDFLDFKIPIRFLCIYIPPNFSSCLSTVSSMCTLINNLCTDSKPCFVIGDFNLPNIDWNVPISNGNASHDFFLNFCTANNWTQHITEPTHNQNNTLDLLLSNILANNILLSSTVNAPLTSTCDHNAISFNVLANNQTKDNIDSQFPNFKKGNYVECLNFLKEIDWDQICNTDCPQSLYDKFICILHDAIRGNVPIYHSPRKKLKKMPAKIKRILKEKLRIYKCMKTDKSLKPKYKQLSHEYEQAVKNWTNNIENNLCKSPSSKKFYNYINKKLKTKPYIPPLLDTSNNKYLYSDKDKSSLLNTFFQSVFTIDDGRLPNTPARDFTRMKDFEISEFDVLEAISGIKDKITRTPEEIPSYFIKRISSSILKPLTFMFNLFLKSHFVPNQWKMSLIIPIHKKNNKSLPNNYRPISLTSSFSRIFESIMHKKIITYLLSNSLISSAQFGFLPKKSSSSQLLSSLHEWFHSISTNNSLKIIYTDIAKAFDSVSHNKLIHVLKSYGINDNVVKWLKEFLNDRKQQVCLGTTISSFLSVSSGIPQGSVIGPLLFIIFFDDIVTCVPQIYGRIGVKLYADDAKLYGTDQPSLQTCVNNLVSWLVDRQLTVAENKCFSLSLSKPRSNVPQANFLINNSAIISKTYAQDLGILISNNLKWSHHVNFIVGKAFSCSYQILKCFKTRSIDVLVKLFKTYVIPKLEFNSEVWSPHLKKDIDRIESVQRLFTKNAFKICGIKFTSYTDRLQKLNLFTLERRRLHKDLVLIYKIIYNLSDLKFYDYYVFAITGYNLRRHSLQIRLKNPLNLKTEQYINSFFVRVVKFWNVLAEDIVRSPSISVFKLKLNTFTFPTV